jgi:hypothetical protein
LEWLEVKRLPASISARIVALDQASGDDAQRVVRCAEDRLQS